MRGRDIFAIFLIAIILILAAIFFYLGLQSRDAARVCTNEESPFCFTVTCRNKTSTCGEFAYRCIDSTTVRCDNAPLVNVAIQAGDGNICG